MCVHGAFPDCGNLSPNFVWSQHLLPQKNYKYALYTCIDNDKFWYLLSKAGKIRFSQADTERVVKWKGIS